MDSSTTVIVVSHDRSFVDEIADELLVLREQQIERFRGNLSTYEAERVKQYKYLTKMQASQDKQRQHMQSTIQGNVQAAKRAGDDKKLKQAASRKKKLEERMGMEVSAKGTRFKLNRDYAGHHLTYRGSIEVPKFDPPAQMKLPVQPSDLRFPGGLVSLEKVGFVYRVNGKQIPILMDVDMTIHLGDRIGITGLNGSGKSTLVSLLMGSTPSGDPVTPSSGTIMRHTRAKFAAYSQQAVEELEVSAAAKPDQTALSHLMESVGPEAHESDARAILSGMGLAGKFASDVPIALLSGGQRVRLALAKILWSPPHVLILDEVTTHLDTDTIQALVTALKRYEGAILVVTHDRFFMRTVVEGVSVRELAALSRPDQEVSEDEESSGDEIEESKKTRVLYRLSKRRLIRLERGMEQYEEIAARSATKLGTY